VLHAHFNHLGICADIGAHHSREKVENVQVQFMNIIIERGKEDPIIEILWKRC
jgi:hypothetical protein